MDNNFRIGIIDNGINQSELIGYNQIEGINIGIKNGRVIMYGNGLVKEIDGHGTICARIIERFAPRSRLFSIRIMNAPGRCSMEALTAAIHWAVEKKLHLLSMSVAVLHSGQIEDLQKVCNLAFEKNMVMIGAKYNCAQAESYPADFRNVVSVHHGIIKKPNLFNPGKFKIKLFISYDDKLFNSELWIWKHLISNSLITPLVTGLIVKRMEICNENTKDVLQHPEKYFSDHHDPYKNFMGKIVIACMSLYRKIKATLTRP